MTETDPYPLYQTVCGGSFTDPNSYPSTLYKGERVYFCTRACLKVFERNPDPFMSGEIDHPIDEDID